VKKQTKDRQKNEGKHCLNFRFIPFNKNKQKTDELKHYLNSPESVEDKNFDIYQFWKVNSLIYPVLSRMARDYLPLQPTSLASEQSFSRGRQFIPYTRARLNDESIKASMIIKGSQHFALS
jgi:hypothetical protein